MDRHEGTLMGRGEAHDRQAGALMGAPSSGAVSPADFEVVTGSAVADAWRPWARPDLWSDDLEILEAFAGPGSPTILVRGAGRRPLLLQRSTSDPQVYENLADDWGENVLLPSSDPAWWRALAEFLTARDRRVGLYLGFTDTLAPLPLAPIDDNPAEEVRYTLPAFPSVDAYLDERLHGERKRRLRRAGPLALERVGYREVWDQLREWQRWRHDDGACLVKPTLDAAFQRVCAVAERRGIDRHFLLRERGEPVAATLGIVLGTHFLYWQDGHAAERGDIGNRTNLSVFAHCFAQGWDVDWMTMTQPFKSDFWHCDTEVRHCATYMMR